MLKTVMLLAVLTGCATVPSGPSVRVLPAEGMPFEEFQKDDATCRQWAQSQLGNPVQETYNEQVATGAVAGTAVGAGVGAALGAVSGNAGAGAAIGAATGLLFGTAAGSGSAQVYGEEAQRRYDNAYLQCMYSYGNQISSYRAQAAAPPPPVVAVPPAPEIYLEAAPQFIWAPELGMYVAVGVPYDLVYTGSAYYYFYGGRWYRGPYYSGPWTYVPRRAYPAPFARYRIGGIRHFRDVQYRYYQRDRGHYSGRFHRPEYRGRRLRP
ncbi:glycine zipper family protein [Geomonas sp.]|uniref:glycine zipper family protein n=1 Tax=Geomonas sp. TaxID=2651584 RepID=UPI002B49EE30|nr:glycine zipper family protein [Geomonas sp.]HJV33775.1 glycine zipper family protein [Geomonas sp.]